MKDNFIVAVLYLSFVGFVAAVVMSFKQPRLPELPPKTDCPNVYETKHVNNTVCVKCHKEIRR